jgi:hypothetical protein
VNRYPADATSAEYERWAGYTCVHGRSSDSCRSCVVEGRICEHGVPLKDEWNLELKQIDCDACLKDGRTCPHGVRNDWRHECEDCDPMTGDNGPYGVGT